MQRNASLDQNANGVLAGIARVLREALTSRTEAELGRACLAVAAELTQSRFGLIGTVNPRTGMLDQVAAGDAGWDLAAVQDRPDAGARVPLGFDIQGVYGRILLNGRGLIAKDPTLHPDDIDVPPGHPPLRSFLGVPLVHEGETMGMLGLGNREGGYGPQELEAVEALAPAVAQALLAKRGEEALRERERQLTGIVESSMDAIVSVDEEQRIRLFNPAAERMFGLSAAQAIGTPLSGLLPGRLRAVHERHVRAFATTGETTRRMGTLGELLALHSDGREFPVEASISQTTVAGVRTATAILRDITEQKRAEEALRDREGKFKAIVYNSPSILSLKLPDGRYALANPNLQRIHKLTEEEILGKTDFDLYPEETARAFQANDALVTSTGTRHSFEETVPVDGEVRTYASHLFPILRDNGTLEYLCRISLDMTERKRAEVSQHWNARRNALLSDTAARLLRSDDPRGLVEDLCRDVMAFLDCQAFFNFLAEPTGERLRLNAFAGISEEEARRIGWLDYGVAVCGCVARDGQRIVAEDIQRLPEPRTTLVQSYGIQAYCCHPLRAQGRVFGTLSFGTRTRVRFSAQDIEVMEAVSDLVAIAMQRIEADRRKDEFLATLAHELRNPLAPIRNACAILKLAGPPDPTVQAARDLIDRQVSHMVRLVDDLLDVGRITRGKLRLRPERVDLAAVLERAVEVARPLVAGAGQTLAVSLPSEPVRLEGDPVRLAQVFANLLDNACKYTPSGGHIRLAVAHEGGDVVVTVADSGAGIPREHLARVFEMFHQVPSDAERIPSGLGIGLSLVRGLVEMHGGRVTAESGGPGQGSTFAVRLPAAAPEPLSPRAPPGAGEMPAGATGRILVVDDKADAAESLALLLRLHGNAVETACDGLEALAAAERFRPDLVLLDLGMPRLDGYGACRQMRERPWGKDLTIVATTGWGQDSDRRRSEAAGFDGHWVKPVAPSAVLDLLAKARARAAGRAGQTTETRTGVHRAFAPGSPNDSIDV